MTASGDRRRLVAAYAAAVVVVFALAAAAAAVYVGVQTGRDERADASRALAFAAKAAAGRLASSIAANRVGVERLATSPQISRAIANPAVCTLLFPATGKADRGHFDILRPDGTVLCSSRKGRLPGYQNASWLPRIRKAPQFFAPVLDTATGDQVALSAIPVRGGIVTGFYDLTAAGPYLASLYNGGRSLEFLVTSQDGGTVVARSLAPRRWVGKSIQGTPFMRDAGGFERRGIDGTRRYYRQVTLEGTGWHLLAGEDKDDVLAAGRHLEHRLLLILLVGLAAVVASAALTYRRLA